MSAQRFRRLRAHPTIRRLTRETVVTPDDLIQPFFVTEGAHRREEIEAMPGIYRYSVDQLLKAIEHYRSVGGRTGLIFGVPSAKDPLGTRAYADDGIVQEAVRAVKKEFSDFFMITDVCLCAYTDHGHCGVVQDGGVDNDQTVALLAQTALSHARAGADMVAPSDMMDLRVAGIREALDRHQYKQVGILSYAAKYQSAFYGPFRDAAKSAPQFGDRAGYQMDPANQREALKEARQDVLEGADIVMVKPALPYLDVIALLRRELDVPVAAYNVSGEYAMVKAAAQKNWVQERAVVMEILTSIKRAGADIIISYHAQQALAWWDQEKR